MITTTVHVTDDGDTWLCDDCAVNCRVDCRVDEIESTFDGSDNQGTSPMCDCCGVVIAVANKEARS